VRVGAYFALGSSSLIPLLHGIQWYGLEYMLQYSGLKWYLLELAFYGGGVGLYAVCLHHRYSIFHYPESQVI
jgi:adiponectin receptor